MAEVTLVAASVPGIAGGPRLPLAPFEQVVGDEAVAVFLPQEAVDVLPVEGRSGLAASTLQVVRDAAGGGEVALAEWAGDFCALVDARVEMLFQASELVGGRERERDVVPYGHTILRLLALSNWRWHGMQ